MNSRYEKSLARTAVVLGVFLAGAGMFGWIPAPRAATEKESPLFEDVTAQAGIDFTYRNGQEAGHYAILETVGGGVALFDYDGDGLLDIFVTGGGYFAGKDKKEIKGHPCRLYKNLGNWKFKDVTKEVGLDNISFYTHGAAVADYDRDGWPDLLVTGWGRVALYHNEPVDPKDPAKGRRFREVTRAAGLTDRSWSTSAAWGDLDGDGFPDLYLCHYLDWSMDNNPACGGLAPKVKRDICPPKKFKSLEHTLYRNNARGTFTDVSKNAGVKYRAKQGKQVEVGMGLGVIIVDVNKDGHPDIYVANDMTGNFLYMNRTNPAKSGARLKLEEVGMQAGVAVDGYGASNGSKGVTAGDYDRSGNPSLFVTNYEDENHGLYQNLGHEQFSFQSRNAGIAAIGQRHVGCGTSFVDVDNDGWEDLVISNGHFIRHPVRTGIKQRPVLFRNDRGKRFEDITSRGGKYFQTDHIGRGLAVGDLDNDGRPDLVISHLNEPVVVLRNVAGEKGPRNHWLGIELAGRTHRDLVGTRVVLEAAGKRRTRFAVGGGSYLSAGDPRHLFGLGKTTKVDKVTVFWSWGQSQTWDGKLFKPDRYWRLVEGQGRPDPWPNQNGRR